MDCENINTSNSSISICDKDDVDNEDQLTIQEDVYLQQSKKSIYFKNCESIFKELQTVINNEDNPAKDLNIHFSLKFALYFLNNWSGLIPLWTCLHIGNQDRHGNSDVYHSWSQHFSERPCVQDPPRTQGIIEFHNKSVKHISLNSKRDRIDKVIGNLLVAKKSKRRQFEILLSRKKVPPSKNDNKIKDTLPKKISEDRWSKRGHKKQFAGPGFFQKNRRKKCNYLKLEDWEKLSVIPWGGEVRISSGQIINLINSCTVDPFLQTLYMFYSLNIQEMRKLFESDHIIVKMICEVVQMLLTEAFTDAKVYWLTKICSFSFDIDTQVLDSFSTDKQITLYHIRHLFKRKYQFICSSDHCPSKSIVNSTCDTVSDMTLHEPSASNTDGKTLPLQKGITEWELGVSEKALVSCKERFVEEPDHQEFISEVDCGQTITRCSGWRTVTNIDFIDSPPFLLFDISNSFRDMINSLDTVPLQVSVYGEIYRLGGVTSFVSSRRHYVGYIAEKQGFLFYDGLPSHNPVLKKCNMTRIHGDISLLFYFPVDDNTDVRMTVDDTTATNASCGKMAAPKKKRKLISNDSTVDDSLLAKALSEIENEGDNMYAKPIGKSYRYKGKPVCDVGRTTEEVKCDSTAQRVRVSELIKYLHFDRDVNTLPGKGKKYLNKLWSDITQNGLQNPLSLSVSRKTGRAVLFDGNHRLTLFRNKEVVWVPLKVSYFFIEDDYSESFTFVPNVYAEDEWPSYPTPENIGFLIKK